MPLTLTRHRPRDAEGVRGPGQTLPADCRWLPRELPHDRGSVAASQTAACRAAGRDTR